MFDRQLHPSSGGHCCSKQGVRMASVDLVGDAPDAGVASYLAWPATGRGDEKLTGSTVRVNGEGEFS